MYLITFLFQFFIDPYKLLPLQRFLEKPKGRGGRGGGRGGGRLCFHYGLTLTCLHRLLSFTFLVKVY